MRAFSDTKLYKLHLDLGLEDPISFYVRQREKYGDRRTGHTTRMLVEAFWECVFGVNIDEVYVVCGTHTNAECVKRQFSKLWDTAHQRGLFDDLGRKFFDYPVFIADDLVVPDDSEARWHRVVLYDNHPDAIPSGNVKIGDYNYLEERVRALQQEKK